MTPKNDNKDYKRNLFKENYFVENNLIYKKPYKFYNKKYEVLKVFDMYFDSEDFNYEKFLKKLEAVEPELRYILNYFKREIRNDYRKDIRKSYSYACTTDDRRGWETYGFDNIESNMSYISDRWSCEFRIQWILDVLYYLKAKNGIVENEVDGV